MSFVQTITFTTDRLDEVKALHKSWGEENGAQSSATRVQFTTSRDNPKQVTVIVEFPSYEEAMKNSERPETQQFAEQMGKLASGAPTFQNLDVITDQTM